MIKKLWRWYKKPRKSFLEQVAEIVFIILPVVFLIRTFGFGLYQVPTGSMETTMLTGERFFADKLTPWFTSIKRGDIIAFDAPPAYFHYSENPIKNLFQRYVWGPDNFTKRVIGIPGDHVEGKIEDGHPVIYLNGVKLHEPYLNKYPLVYVFKQQLPSFQDMIVGNYSATPVSYDRNSSYDKQPFYRINPDLLIKDRFNVPLMIEPGTPLPEGKDVFDVKLGKNQYWVMGDNREGSADSRMWGILDGKFIHAKVIFRIWSIDSDHSWWIFDLLLHPIDFWKRIRWSRCLQFVS